MMIRSLVVWCSLSLAAAAADPGALFEEAERLSRSGQNIEAMAKVEEAVAEIDRAHAAGEQISWQGRNGLRFAARLAREDFLDYEESFRFCDKLFELADTDYWRVPARLERAMTYRAMGNYEKAQAEYDAIAKADQRRRTSALMPQAEMAYFDVGDRERGRKLMVAALMNQDIHGRERFGALRKCAQEAMSRGRREEALKWYAMLEKLPFDKAEERARFLSRAWYEMGKIEESLGRTAEAKAHYRRAMDLDDGQMRFRARARDALESIEYFE
jgi:tetratricopeptide (TPR) repeat protein